MNILQKYNYKEVFKGKVWFLSFISVFYILFFIVQNINHRFWLHDYEVYYSAANSFLRGDAVYGIPYGLGSGYYKYSPFALLVFAPFSLLPFYVAKVFHFVILSICITTTIILSYKLIISNFPLKNNIKNPNLLLFLIFLPLIPNIYTELHLGNINSALLLIFIIALLYLMKGKDLKAGLLLALGILIKPHFLIFLPFLLFRKKFNCFIYTVIGIIAGLLLPSLFIGMGHNVELHKQWLTTMQIHNNSLISGQDTLFSWLYRGVGHFFFIDTLQYDKIFGMLVLAIIAFVILALLIIDLKKENSDKSMQDNKTKNFIFEYFILLAIIPNITVTDSEHFLLSIPLIAFIVIYLFKKSENLIFKIFAIILLFIYGMNMREVVGKNISAYFTEYGILGLANILIIIFCIIVHIKQIKIANRISKQITKV
jgi:hypothetical protein